MHKKDQLFSLVYGHFDFDDDFEVELLLASLLRNRNAHKWQNFAHNVIFV